MPSLSLPSLFPSQSPATKESRIVRFRITTFLTCSSWNPPPTISAPRPTPAMVVSPETGRFVPKGATAMVPSTSTTVGAGRAIASARASTVRTVTISPPRPPTAPCVSPSAGTPAKPVAYGDHTGPSAVAGPRGTRMRRSRSPACLPRSEARAGGTRRRRGRSRAGLSGSEACGGAATAGATVPAARAVPPTAAPRRRWRRGIERMIFLDLLFLQVRTGHRRTVECAGPSAGADGQVSRPSTARDGGRLPEGGGRQCERCRGWEASRARSSASDRADHGALDEVALHDGMDCGHGEGGHGDHGHLHRLRRRDDVDHCCVGVHAAGDDDDLAQQHL